VSVACRDGRLVQAATRGDGREGEDVTHNVMTPGAVQGLTVTVGGTAGGKAVPADFEVRGEIYIRSSDFDKVRIGCGSVGERSIIPGGMPTVFPACASIMPAQLCVGYPTTAPCHTTSGG